MWNVSLEECMSEVECCVLKCLTWRGWESTIWAKDDLPTCGKA